MSWQSIFFSYQLTQLEPLEPPTLRFYAISLEIANILDRGANGCQKFFQNRIT